METITETEITLYSQIEFFYTGLMSLASTTELTVRSATEKRQIQSCLQKLRQERIKYKNRPGRLAAIDERSTDFNQRIITLNQFLSDVQNQKSLA